MSDQPAALSRRSFTKAAAVATAASAFAVPAVHAAGSDVVNVALVGCGGRGGGAIVDALDTTSGPIKLTAMADVFQNRLDGTLQGISRNEKHKDKVDVGDRKFVGFDGYKRAMDSMKKGDVVILTTPPAFRWVMFKYAIEKGLNVFMEKPVTVDGPTSRKMLALGEEAAKKNLKVAVGLMCRHCDARKELHSRIKDGEIGDIVTLRAYRMHGPVGSFQTGPNKNKQPETLFQISKFHSFLWASGGAFSDFYIHNIDESCWMKDAWPVKAQATGGRHFRGDFVDQNFDNYSVEYTFADGTKFFMYGRCMDQTYNQFASFAHGTKGLGVISTNSHTPARCRTYKGQAMKNDNLIWKFPDNEPNPYKLEWVHFIDAIRNDKPWNEVKRGVEASLVTSMGRMAAHTGQEVTYDQILNQGMEFAPDVENLTQDGPAPVKPDENGKYPVPQPGKLGLREY